MTENASFEPIPFQPVSDPRQLKAFTDPMRNRILHILAGREATNQQLAALLDQPQAKVLYHVRFLVDAGLVVLVDQRVKGGNVEKYYRASARTYGFRPDPADAGALAGEVSGAGLEAVTQEVLASRKLWPDQPHFWEGRRARLSAERQAEFNDRLLALLTEFWGKVDEPEAGEPDDDLMAFAMVMYRFPGDEA